MEVDEALGKLGLRGNMRYYTMIGIARGFPPCFHMLAINFIGNREILYIFVSSNHGSSSVKYSRHNIQQNRQTKKNKKLNYTLHFCVLFRFMVSTFGFLPCDAMLARYMLSSCVLLSVRPSQAGIVSKHQDESSWYLAQWLPSTYPTLCYKDIYVSPKITVLPAGTLSRTSHWRHFRHGKSIALSTTLIVVVVDGRVCFC